MANPVDCCQNLFIPRHFMPPAGLGTLGTITASPFEIKKRELKFVPAAIFNCPAEHQDELVIDNKAVVDHGAILPHRECVDMYPRGIIYGQQERKQLKWGWIPSHRTKKAYHTPEQITDIKHNGHRVCPYLNPQKES